MNRTNIEISAKTPLVLEGGGMRGVFTCGVLDSFMDKGVHFPYVIGVSAGACNGLSYMSGQRGRARFSNIEMMEKYHYIRLKNLVTKHNLIDFQLLFHDFPERIVPYDYDAYAHSPSRFVVVTTDCKSGRARYFEEKHDIPRIVDIVKASSSLPFVCPIAYVDGRPMLDGGIVDSIPLKRALEDGYTDKPVVVLTRNKGYRKDIIGTKVPSFIYKEYPRLRVAINHRCYLYNDQLEMVERMEDEGKITVIRPEKPIEVDRIERNIDKLEALYDEGYQLASQLQFTPKNFLAE